MAQQQAHLEERITSGKPVLIVEAAPPRGGDAEAVRARAKRFSGKVHALGVSDNRGDVRMSALAAALLVASEGVEPILHVVTRDRNRMALASEYLGAQALGVRNLLCTTGMHQTLGRCRQARNVFDLDSIQLLQMYAGFNSDHSLAGAEGNGQGGSLCLGAVASPYADPLEMQVMRLAKKVAAGAKFLITQPLFDFERFEAWWREVTNRGIHEKAAIFAGVYPLADAEDADAHAATDSCGSIPDMILKRLSAKSDKAAQRAAGIEIACETIGKLSGLDGLRGFEIRSDGDDEAVLEVIEKAGLRCD